MTVRDNIQTDLPHLLPQGFGSHFQRLAFVVLLLATIPLFADASSPSIATLRYGVTSLPQDHGKGRSRYWQLENAINLELARRAGLTPVAVDCPFRRCHADLVSGRIDILSLVRPTKARAENEYFLSIWGIPGGSLRFYVRRGEESRLSTLHDLFDLQLGLLHGAAYTTFIDLDKRLHRTYAAKPILLPKMLMSGRIDTFISAHIPAYAMREHFPDAVLAQIKHPVPPVALTALGRHSERAVELRAILSEVMRRMVAERTVEQLFESYGYPEPELMVPVGIDWHMSSVVSDSPVNVDSKESR